MTVQGLTDKEAWELLSSDPLAYIRELALAHHERLRDEAAEAECAVLILDDYRTETT